jgi:hypothetical protein
MAAKAQANRPTLHNGETALFFLVRNPAPESEKKAALEALLQAGADATLTNHVGYTALHYFRYESRTVNGNTFSAHHLFKTPTTLYTHGRKLRSCGYDGLRRRGSPQSVRSLAGTCSRSDDKKCDDNKLENKSSAAQLISKSTTRDGACAFHAILGEWDQQKQAYYYKNVTSIRRKIATAINRVKPADAIYSRVKTALREMVASNKK